MIGGAIWQNGFIFIYKDSVTLALFISLLLSIKSRNDCDCHSFLMFYLLLSCCFFSCIFILRLWKIFLGADKNLYRWVCPSVWPSFRPSVCYAFSISAVSTCLLVLRGHYWLFFLCTLLGQLTRRNTRHKMRLARV